MYATQHERRTDTETSIYQRYKESTSDGSSLVSLLYDTGASEGELKWYGQDPREFIITSPERKHKLRRANCHAHYDYC